MLHLLQRNPLFAQAFLDRLRTSSILQKAGYSLSQPHPRTLWIQHPGLPIPTLMPPTHTREAERLISRRLSLDCHRVHRSPSLALLPRGRGWLTFLQAVLPFHLLYMHPFLFQSMCPSLFTTTRPPFLPPTCPFILPSVRLLFPAYMGPLHPYLSHRKSWQTPQSTSSNGPSPSPFPSFPFSPTQS